MKNIKIFSKDWLSLHPYVQSTPVDAYYTNIANRIYDILAATELTNSFKGDEAKQIAIRMAAYYEDVISQTNIWRVFISDFKERYGHYLPFYKTGDHYYEDEANLEDVRFLLWHYTQQYHGWRKGTFVNPDNPANQAAANMIYKIFCDEWTTAPENERMQALFSKETRYDDDPKKYNDLLYWFHYHSYPVTDANEELTDTTKSYWEKEGKQVDPKDLLTFHDLLAHISHTPFLAYTSPMWLSKLIPEDHPDYAMFKEEADKSMAFVSPEDAKRRELAKPDYQKFKEVVPDDLILYMKSEQEFYDFLTQKIGINFKDGRPEPGERHFAVYASEEDGIQVLTLDVDCIKDEKNPFYNKERAEQAALGFFIVKHCSTSLLIEMVKRGMLADAQTKSLLGEERGKDIIQNNWKFLIEYFHKERVD